MYKYLATFTIIGFLASCEMKEEELPAGLRAGGFTVSDLEKRSVLLQRFSDQSIPYEVDEKGFIRYMQRDTAKVRKIQRHTLDNVKDENTFFRSEVIRDERYKKLITSRFGDQGIPYEIEVMQGTEQIIWRSIYDDKVDFIIQDVGLEWYEKRN